MGMEKVLRTCDEWELFYKKCFDILDEHGCIPHGASSSKKESFTSCLLDEDAHTTEYRLEGGFVFSGTFYRSKGLIYFIFDDDPDQDLVTVQNALNSKLEKIQAEFLIRQDDWLAHTYIYGPPLRHKLKIIENIQFLKENLNYAKALAEYLMMSLDDYLSSLDVLKNLIETERFQHE